MHVKFGWLPEWLRRIVWNNPVASDWDLWWVFLFGDGRFCVEGNGDGAGTCNPTTRCFRPSFPFGLKHYTCLEINVRFKFTYNCSLVDPLKIPCCFSAYWFYLSSSDRIRFFNLVPWDFFFDGKWASELYASNSQAHFNEKSADCLHLQSNWFV